MKRRRNRLRRGTTWDIGRGRKEGSNRRREKSIEVMWRDASMPLKWKNKWKKDTCRETKKEEEIYTWDSRMNIFNSCFVLQVLSNARLFLENLLRWVSLESFFFYSCLFHITNKLLLLLSCVLVHNISFLNRDSSDVNDEQYQNRSSQKFHNLLPALAECFY